MTTLEYPARLHVILAREANRGVILRRGPTNWVRVILWHTDTDQFEGGQWLRGRIYGERCALSPDGSLFLYFAAQQHKRRDGYHGTWTAISKPPYLTALALWPIGDAWSSGGMFLDNRTIRLHNEIIQPHPDHMPPPQLRVITRDGLLTKRERAALEQIQARDWQLVHRPANQSDLYGYGRRVKDPIVWRLVHPTNERYYLVRRYYGYIPKRYPSPSITEYALWDRNNNTERALEGVNWADWDQRGRLAYTRDGQIFAQEPQQIGIFARPLADFNDQTFDDVPPPDWATRW